MRTKTHISLAGSGGHHEGKDWSPTLGVLPPANRKPLSVTRERPNPLSGSPEFPPPLRQDALDHVPLHVGQAEVSPLELEGQTRVVDTQAVEDRGVQVVHVCYAAAYSRAIETHLPRGSRYQEAGSWPTRRQRYGYRFPGFA